VKALRKLAPKLQTTVSWLETGRQDPAELAVLVLEHAGKAAAEGCDAAGANDPAGRPATWARMKRRGGSMPPSGSRRALGAYAGLSRESSRVGRRAGGGATRAFLAPS
jgi:hypothetical protein